MSLVVLDPQSPVPATGASAVVCVPLYGAHEEFVQCLHSLIEHTPHEVPILVADDAGPDPASLAWVRGLDAAGVLTHQVYWSRAETNGGFVVNSNRAFAATAPADVVLVNSDVVVAAGWFEGLRDAAYSDSQVATATALTNNGTIVSVPNRNTPLAALPQDVTLDEVAAGVRARSQRLRPELPTAIGHCLYIRRDALQLVGDFDEAFSPGYGEEVDFSQRCRRMGLRHVLADDVLVLHHGQASLGVDGERNPVQDEHEEIVRARWSYYHAAVAEAAGDQHGPFGRALEIASRTVTTLRVTIDGHCLRGPTTGTQVHTLELIGSLWRTRRARVRVLAPLDLSPVAQEAFAEMPGLELVSTEHADAVNVSLDDIVHRPYQVTSQADVRMLLRVGHRVVLTHQDLIAFRNPAYFPDSSVWLTYRQLTRETLAIADRVLFFSEHAADDARREALVDVDRSQVVPIGVDHRCVPDVGRTPPPSSSGLDGRPFLVVLGTDMHHKNRVFAMRLFARLREAHGWDGQLVLAGPRAAHGSSAGTEAAWTAANPGAAEHVVHLPAVSDPVKEWLLAEAAAVLYPTTYEGFGLLPFEAANVGTPCLFAPVASLGELAAEAATIVPWDVERSAEAAFEVLSDPGRAAHLVRAVAERSALLTWDRTGDALIAAYDAALAAPVTPARATREADLVRDGRYWHLRNAIGPTGMSLVEPREGLLPVSSQRALAALARRKLTRGPLIGFLNVVQRMTSGKRPEPSYDMLEAVAAKRAVGEDRD